METEHKKHKRKHKRHKGLCFVCFLLCLLSSVPLVSAQRPAPNYEVDPSWPKPLPNRWVVGQVGGVCVDAQDHVFLLNRQDLKDEELDAGRMAPGVIEFDSQGGV